MTSLEHMDFAEKELKKYGWVKGNGLGKNEKGLTEPIKVKLKRDSAGLGCDAASEFNSHWWDTAFNQAASNIHVLEGVEGSIVAVKTRTDSSSKRKKMHYGNHRKELYYGGFLASSSSHSGQCDIGDSTEEEERDGKEEVGERCVDDGRGGRMEVHPDERLFEACGGRTAHKAARHGCKLSGKLQRLQDQERAVQLGMVQKGLEGGKEARKGQMKKKHRDREYCSNKKQKQKIHNSEFLL